MPLLLAGAMTTVSAAGGALSQTAQLAHPASCIAALLLRSLPQQAILQRKAGLLAGQLPAAGAAAVHAASSAQEQQLPNGWPWLCEQHASHYDGGDEAVVHDRLAILGNQALRLVQIILKVLFARHIVYVYQVLCTCARDQA